VEDNWKMFAGHLKPIQNRQAEPSKLTSVKVKRMCMKKQRLYRKAKKSGSLEHRAEFKKLHNETHDTLTAAHWSYVNDILLEFLERGYTKPFYRSNHNNRAKVFQLSAYMASCILMQHKRGY